SQPLRRAAKPLGVNQNPDVIGVAAPTGRSTAEHDHPVGRRIKRGIALVVSDRRRAPNRCQLTPRLSRKCRCKKDDHEESRQEHSPMVQPCIARPKSAATQTGENSTGKPNGYQGEKSDNCDEQHGFASSSLFPSSATSAA